MDLRIGTTRLPRKRRNTGDIVSVRKFQLKSCGKDRLRYLFPKLIRSIFVPPGIDGRRHITPSHTGSKLSTFGPAKTNIELQQINTHIDIIDWRGTRGFVGQAVALVILCDHLFKRRISEIHTGMAIGLMTHHLNHDKETTALLGAPNRGHVAPSGM